MIEGTRLKPELAATVGQWDYIGCHCLVEIGSGAVAEITYQCDACSNTNLRFIHTLESLDGKRRQINVGIECACVLMNSNIPYLAENETKRKERWRREVYFRPGRCCTTIDDLIERGKL